VATVHDVAAYILKRRSPMTAMKLQKLVYYCQAWSLVWDEAPLFPECIEAWANGPVVRELYEQHRGKFLVNSLERGNAEALDKAQRETVDAVMNFYGDKPSQWLSDLTHQESPWRDARTGIAPGAFSDREINTASMAEYYSGLAAAR
jgi:uncharacterized phage-associated protein